MPSLMISPSKIYEKERRPAFIFNASLDKRSALILCSLYTWIKSYKQIYDVGGISYMSDIQRNALLSPTSLDEFTFWELLTLHRPDHTTSRSFLQPTLVWLIIFLATPLSLIYTCRLTYNLENLLTHHNKLPSKSSPDSHYGFEVVLVASGSII